MSQTVQLPGSNRYSALTAHNPNQRQDLSPRPGPKAQLKRFAHAVSKGAVKKSSAGTSPLTHPMSL